MLNRTREMHPVGISSTRTSDRPISGNPHSTTCQQGFSSNVGEERMSQRTVNEDVGHEPERGGQASAEHGYLPHVHLC